MPFKVTPFRLEMIADILFVLGVIVSVVLFTDSIIMGLVVLATVFVISFVLYAVAQILENTQKIIERLDRMGYPRAEEEENEDEE